LLLRTRKGREMSDQDENRISLDELWVIADYGYHGDPGCNGYAYSSKEEAQAIVDKTKKNYPKLHYKVMSVQDYIWQNKRYQDHNCGIC